MENNILYIKTVYIILNFFYFLIIWKQGRKLKRCNTNKDYWGIAKWIVLSYGVVMGLRFGRMIDYNVYFNRYVEIGEHFHRSNYEIGFKIICWTLYNAGVPYWGFICFCSLLIMYALLYLLKDKYRVYAPYSCMLFLMEASNVENYIRWYLAFAFIILSYAVLRKEKWSYALALGVFSVLVHVGSLLVVAIIGGLYFIKKQLIPPLVVEVLFLASLLGGKVGLLEPLETFMPTIALIDEKSAVYAAKFTDLITGNFGHIGLRDERSISNIIRLIGAYTFPILMTATLVENKKITALEANLFCVGVILFPLFMQVEILDRYASSLLFFSVIVSAASYVYFWEKRKRYHNSWTILFWISIVFNMEPVIMNVFYRNDWWTMLFIWDANGRNVLPLHYFQNF